MNRIFIFVLGLSIASTSFSIAQAQPQPAPAAAHPVVTALSKEGVNKGCLPKAEQVSRFLTGGGNTGAFILLPTSGRDKNAFSISFEILEKDVLSYATASFAPDGAGGCHAQYEIVTHWRRTCDEVWKAVVPQLKAEGQIRKTIHVMGGLGDDAKMFLVPTDGGLTCLAIKKEMLFVAKTTAPKPAVVADDSAAKALKRKKP